MVKKKDEGVFPVRRADIERSKILVVDDEPDVVSSMSSWLRAKNYKVISASDGIEGLKKTFDETPDLILLDLKMPRKDGFSMLRELKVNDSTSEIPIIIVSAKSETKFLFEGKRLGVDDYFIKPFNLEKLLRAIRKYL